MPATANEITSALQKSFPSIQVRSSADLEAITVSLADVPAVLQALREQHGFDLLADVTAVDWTADVTPRFTVFYHLYGTETHTYIRVAANCTDDIEPVAPSVTGLWAGADWHERETYDMFGIKFEGHPDLRRILMWDDYPYYPLRKDFPLAGIDVELPDSEVASETGASVKPAPMMGGPFVASTGEMNMRLAEPRAKDESWTEEKEKPQGPNNG